MILKILKTFVEMKNKKTDFIEYNGILNINYQSIICSSNDLITFVHYLKGMK